MSKLINLLADKAGIEKTTAFNTYLSQQAWHKNIPLMGLFELTPRCTLDCKMCYVHLNDPQMFQRELSTEQWITIIDEACDAGMMYATLSGGECFLHPGFKKIYEHLQLKGIIVSIFTNGTLLDEKMVAWLAKRMPRKIQISIYGSSAEGYRAVTGAGSAFQKVNTAIDLIKQAKIPFSLAITVSKYMLDDFEAILKYCESKEPLTINLSAYPFQAREETEREYDGFAPSLDEQVECYKTRIRVDGGRVIPFKRVVEEKIENTGDGGNGTGLEGIGCTAGRTRFSISWEGTMLACNAFNFAEAYPLKDGFAAAWKYINKRAIEYVMPVECVDCEYNTVCIRCPAVHWLAVGEGHCNPEVCAEGKRMVAEGFREL